MHIICRVNNDFEGTTEPQIESAIINGANSIIIPMVEDAKQIIRAISAIQGRAKLIIMIESQAGVENLEALVKCKFDAIYVGLNDLSISRGGSSLFEPLSDGTVKRIIATSKVPVGVGGVTDPSLGELVKSEYIIKKYAELGVKFSVLRRSFEQAITKNSPDIVISNIKKCYVDYRKETVNLRSEVI